MEFPDLLQHEYWGYDTETTGLNFPKDQVFGFSITTPNRKSYYYDIRKTPKAVQWFNDQIKQYKGQIWAHNMPFDYSMSVITGINLRPLMDRNALNDTAMRAILLDEHLFSYRLDDLGARYIDMQKEEIWQDLADIFGGLATKNVQIKNLPKAPVELVARYCNRDSLMVVLLKEWQDKEIESQAREDVAEGAGIRDIMRHEKRWMPMFIRRKMEGIRVDVDYAIEAADKLTPMIDQAKKDMNKLAGRDFNVNSGPQIKALFEPKLVADNKIKTRKIWQANDGTIVGTTQKGEASFGATFLREMTHPAAAKIQEIRSLIKTRDTFLLGHVVEHSYGGRVFPNINQNKGEDGGTGTGRLSASNPALQQIPSRNKKIAAIVKPSFLPEEGQIWIDSDMHSFEVRVFAHLTNMQKIIDEYHKNPELDLHQYVADMSGLPRDAEYPGQPYAKQLNLSMIFNQGKGTTALKMGMPWEWDSFIPKGSDEEDRVWYQRAGPEATKVIDDYHARLPGVKELADGCKRAAETRGFIFTSIGRRIRFPRGYKSYKASGLLIQATAADLNKQNWEIATEQLGDEGTLLLNTHDSYGMSMPGKGWKKIFNRVKQEIEKPRLKVPLILELSGKGDNWWEAIK